MTNDSKFINREKDWRNGAIIYQVLVDRFAPALDLNKKIHLYHHPRVLKSWNEIPVPGSFNEEAKYYQHELEFWGGDLKSLESKLDYIKSLNIDVVYLNPIHQSLSNHKYDATDYMKISEEFGDFKDLESLIHKIHEKNMKIMLDGVFNHVGVQNIYYQKALSGETKYQKWFDFNHKYPEGVRLWADAKSLPELNLENDEVQDYIYRKSDSVIKSYLKKGIDGWRLDVAFDIGFDYLKALTHEAHIEKEGSMIVGEIWNYPKKWFDSIDGIMNFTFREWIELVINQKLDPNQANQMMKFMIDDCGIEPLLKSWLVLDNHDVMRLHEWISDKDQRKLAQILQFTLPGSPNLYYGTELGMMGGNDPLNRAPMRWDLVHDKNETLLWVKSLIHLHQNERSLRIGDYLPIFSKHLISFERVTEHVSETILIFVNPNREEIEEKVLIPDAKLMNYSAFDIVLGDAHNIHLRAGFLNIKLKPKSFVILKPVTKPEKSYTPYKRV